MARALGFLSIVITMAVGMYIYSSQLKSAAPAGTANPEASVNIIAVQNDLVSIARAERQYLAEKGSYASLNELVSANFITIKGERPPYSYQVETSSDSFRVTATRSTPGSPTQIWIDDSMQVHSSN
ncbi:MAG TPA: hypothetical protein VF011_08755 [Terriglobales bacterium]